MLLVMDVGNTNIVLGLYKGNQIKHHWRMGTKWERTSDEFGTQMMQFFFFENIKKEEIEAVIISSVVPPIMYTIENAIRKYIGKSPLIVGPGIKTGINIKVDNPKEVGADRIVNAVAGIELYGGPLIIVDFGTATTFCAVNEKSEYLGGVICPGVKISMEALFEKAAKLPRVELIKPPKTIGKNTVMSMQAGAIYGYVGSADYIVNRMKEELGGKAKVVATGGLARMIAEESKTIDLINRDLTLEGLRIIYERNKEEN